jgi:Ca2+-binding EF-hand superfamily protein
MALLIAPLALAVYIANDQLKEVTECEASRADRIRGAYENKIRFFSSPEKVFEVFSSINTESGELRMSYADFLHALTPYTHGELSTCSEKYLEENKDKIKNIIDFDGDGSISFPEFVFFLTVFQIPPGILRKTFRKYEDGKMNKQQFSEELSELRHKTLQGSK